MGVEDALKGTSSASMTCSDNFKFNHNSVNRYNPKIISYLPLAESTWHLHFAIFVALSADKVKYALTL